MTPSKPPIAVSAADAPPRTKPSNYPEPFAALMAGRVKRPLGELFGLANFGVNLVTLPPGACGLTFDAHLDRCETDRRGGILRLTGDIRRNLAYTTNAPLRRNPFNP